jgi:hypothetical protein
MGWEKKHQSALTTRVFINFILGFNLVGWELSRGHCVIGQRQKATSEQ